MLTAAGRFRHAIVTAVTNQNSITVRIGRTASSFTRTAFNAPWTVAAAPATAPGTPTSVAASAVGSTVTVTWTAPSNGGSAITAYVIQRSPDGTNWTTVSDTDGNATNATATLTSQANGTYTYRVAATNSVGTGSYGVSDSVVVSVATVPAAPSAFAQSGGAQQIGEGPVVISWTAPANGGAAITSYSITYTWNNSDTGAVLATLHTTSQAGNSYTIAEAASHGYSPNAAQAGAQPRWVWGDWYYKVTVSATNSVGTGTAGVYSFSTGGGS